MVASVVILDSGPLGLLTNRKPRPGSDAERCAVWLSELLQAGTVVVIPEVCDYEVRRELIRAGLTGSIERLDYLKHALWYVPITTTAMKEAAHIWAIARNAGLPTAASASLDGDAVLAGQAKTLGSPTIVATTNERHLSRLCSAELWADIRPAI
jgi:predicted nucleic acid-binding protein